MQLIYFNAFCTKKSCRIRITQKLGNFYINFSNKLTEIIRTHTKQIKRCMVHCMSSRKNCLELSEDWLRHTHTHTLVRIPFTFQCTVRKTKLTKKSISGIAISSFVHITHDFEMWRQYE